MPIPYIIQFLDLKIMSFCSGLSKTRLSSSSLVSREKAMGNYRYIPKAPILGPAKRSIIK